MGNVIRKPVKREVKNVNYQREYTSWHGVVILVAVELNIHRNFIFLKISRALCLNKLGEIFIIVINLLPYDGEIFRKQKFQ